MPARVSSGLVEPQLFAATAEAMSGRVASLRARHLRLPPFFRQRLATPAEAPHPLNGAALARLHVRALASTLSRPLVGGNRVDVLVDAPSTYEAMFEAIAAARDHINLESYILEAEGPGESLAELLLQKRAQGLCVSVIFDSFGSLRTSGEYFRRLQAAGVALCEYKPGKPVAAAIAARVAPARSPQAADCRRPDRVRRRHQFQLGVRVRFGGHAHHR
jgi:phosphatidylserine/phosphatidylglycerophosphate/cardiolipin synthase-like enzyme